ncbi:hypothetical protein HS088_TW07G01305 [Tripterygium wilfordii]|uniref:Uncharacterized protein n=1 Tax=Tripterygium wilfordii TaxID=458696 RepID=A0A7J7DHC4_TRIWF|nr:hypothetical protein HS088_TW07G01305 [Tripterygium wilfordii]
MSSLMRLWMNTKIALRSPSRRCLECQKLLQKEMPMLKKLRVLFRFKQLLQTEVSSSSPLLVATSYSRSMLFILDMIRILYPMTMLQLLFEIETLDGFLNNESNAYLSYVVLGLLCVY